MKDVLKPATRLHSHSTSDAIGKYYTHGRENNNAHPLLKIYETIRRVRPLYFSAPLGSTVSPFKLEIASPKPRRPIFVDHHYASLPIVSDKIKNAIEPLVTRSIEFVPAIFESAKERRPYWILHPLKSHDIIDHVNSDYEKEFDTGSISWINKLFIQQSRLITIEQEDRMVFLAEKTANTFLWHEDVVRAIQDVQATGIRFFPADGFSQDSVFD